MYIRTTLTLIFATVFVGQAQAATNAWDGFVNRHPLRHELPAHICHDP